MGKRILVVSKGFIHPSILCRYTFKELLLNLNDSFNFTFTNNLKGLGRLKEGDYQGVILYYHEKKISEDIMDILKNFTHTGGGVLAIHSAMASFKENLEYQDILGGKFIGHGKVGDIKVVSRPEDGSNTKKPISFIIKDELYIHEYDKSNRIILTSEHQGVEEPVLWTKIYGSGRIAYFSLGHCPKTFRNQNVSQLIGSKLRWITNHREDI